MASAKQPSLKSASGAGFTFEDKVAAMLLCEMLASIRSLGPTLGTTQRIERQAGDWEPFGDLLLEITNPTGEPLKCGVSVKSNRQITSNGCNSEASAGLWRVLAKPAFIADRDFLSIMCALLSPAVKDHLDSLLLQARNIEPRRLDQKVVHSEMRKIYDSFHSPTETGDPGLPGRVLARLIAREFDFEANVSTSETAAIATCRETLTPAEATDQKASELWKELCDIASQLRTSGGALTREGIVAKLRSHFRLRDDSADLSAWTLIRDFSRQGLDEIQVELPGNLRLPRVALRAALRTALTEQNACYVLGDSGLGKSALIKEHCIEAASTGAEIVWVRADQLQKLTASVPNFAEVAKRCRRSSALLVVDALESCVTPEAFAAISRFVQALAADKGSTWYVIFACQTPEWARVHKGLVRHLAGHPALERRVECGSLAKEDIDLVCAAFPSVAILMQQPQLRRVLSSPKMLDLVLTGQLAEGRTLAGEADLVDWWWEKQVRGAKPIAAEERVARELASRMADELRSELPADSVGGAEDAASVLIKHRVLQRTADGLLRFEHDLLADWTRVIYLRGLGEETVPFIRRHTENPPWLRAVRLLSQHLLDRVGQLDRWREVISICTATERPNSDPSAENLQLIDAWLEGVIFSVDPSRVLVDVENDLFDREGWLLRRLLWRMMYVGTVPDPVIQERLSKIDPKNAGAAAARYRLPMWSLWSPFVDFFTNHAHRVTDVAPLELAEIAGMWSRLEEYLGVEWATLANLVVENAEKELRREVAGEYRHDSGSRSMSGRSNSRVTIYTAALKAASQVPERGAKLVGKAAGIAPWDEGDLSPKSRCTWRGEWEESHSRSVGESYVERPVRSWDGGPTRETSDDFFHAWFDPSAPLSVFRHEPDIACKATLGFLIDWPKRILFPGGHHSSGVDHYGFNFEADHMYPPFYTKGPFLSFLRESWSSALDLVIQLTNFATDRYADWWPYDPKPTVIQFANFGGTASWLGNHQVYAWNRYHMNTAQVVTCALMSLEKWLDEQIEAGQSISPAVQLIWQNSRSQAFAGVLIAIGKRHPELFADVLKPLLFVREFYLHDMHAVREGVGGGYWPRDGEFISNLRRAWETLPGRKTGLLDISCKWLLTRSDLQPVLAEVATAWRNAADTLPEESPEKLVLRRWASNFDFSMWKEVTLADGRKAWQHQRPEELRDIEAEEAHARHQALLTLPFQCSELLDRRPALSPEQFEGIWQQLHNWSAFEQHSDGTREDDEFGSSLLDHRHARGGLIAVLLCLGGEWLDLEPTRRPWIEEELWKLFRDMPKVKAFTADDIHEDCEGFVARAAVTCWANAPESEQWRAMVGSLVAVYRYGTIQRLFEEAFHKRGKLGSAFREFEALLLSYAGAREEAALESVRPQPEVIENWVRRWIPRFSSRQGPKWKSDWAEIEIAKSFPPPSEHHYGIPGKEWHRRGYGLDVQVLLAAFGRLPRLAEAASPEERAHWIGICKELLAAYLRTLPQGPGDDEDDWDLQPWTVDEKIVEIVASRVFECSGEEQRSLWLPILSLPPAAHHHITQFLNDVLLECIRTDPPHIAELLPLWRAMTKHLLDSPLWTTGLRRKENDVWKHIFLYGASVTSAGDNDHVPFVRGLRDLFECHVRTMRADPYDQSSLAAFLLTAAGEQLLVDALDWLSESWQHASSYFWKRVNEHHYFEALLQRAWQKHFAQIRRRPEALKAFKRLTLNLASLQVTAAVEIQRQIGST